MHFVVHLSQCSALQSITKKSVFIIIEIAYDIMLFFRRVMILFSCENFVAEIMMGLLKSLWKNYI